MSTRNRTRKRNRQARKKGCVSQSLNSVILVKRQPTNSKNQGGKTEKDGPSRAADGRVTDSSRDLRPTVSSVCMHISIHSHCIPMLL